MFERKSMEQIVTKMIKWARGTSRKLTDFRIGSRTRTLFEAVAVVIEEFNDRVHRSMRKTIEENLYSIIGFDKIPSSYATGIARFSRSLPAEQNFVIPAGTVIMSNPTALQAPIRYRTTDDYVLEIGETYIDVPIISETAGTRGNAGVDSIVTFANQPTGIEFVTNPTALTNGTEEETLEEQKTRFADFIQSNNRGTLSSIEYGAKQAVRTDADGNVLERIFQARAVEYLPERKGEIDIYVWNGIGNTSSAMKEVVRNILYGYYDENGEAVHGYKPAGIFINLYDAPIVDIYVKLELEAETWSSLDEIAPLAEGEIDSYFGQLKMGQRIIQTAIESNIKRIDGVADCKFYLSRDGVTYTTDNVVVNEMDMGLVVKPIEVVPLGVTE